MSTGARELVEDMARRPVDAAREVLAEITDEQLHEQPGGTQNSIAWLLWHAARQQDVQIAQLENARQVWVEQGWAQRFDLDRPEEDFGLGDTPEQVASVRVADPALLQGYLEATVEATINYVRGLDDDELDEVVDTSWDPPVTRGVRIVSTVDDTTQHVGQAAYVRGLVGRGWRAAH